MSKRQMMREKRAREQKRNRLISILLIVVGVVAVFSLFIGPQVMQIVNPPTPVPLLTPMVPAPRERPNTNDNAMGDPNAPITITEYSDYQCPYCQHFWANTEEQLVQAYVITGKVHYVYRSFGEFIGAESRAAAEAAYCAADQGQFWAMHDMIFNNQTGENVGAFTTQNLDTMAEVVGLDMTTFKSCLDSGKYSSRVTQDGIDGQSAGIQATPSFVVSYVVNGETKTQIIQGAEPFSTFQSTIDAALAEMGQ